MSDVSRDTLGPGRTLRSVESDPGACTVARQVQHRDQHMRLWDRVRQKRSRPTDGISDNIDMLKAYGRGMDSASAQATRKGRSSLPGCSDLRGGEGVRTVGRLHPGQRLLKQRPKTQCENVGSSMAPAIRECSLRLLCHAWNCAGRFWSAGTLGGPIGQRTSCSPSTTSPSSVPWSRAVCVRVLLRFPTVGQSRHTDSVARRAPP